MYPSARQFNQQLAAIYLLVSIRMKARRVIAAYQTFIRMEDMQRNVTVPP